MTGGPLGSVAGLRDALESAWRRSDEIFALLTDAAWYERPIALRQPFIFYVGHLPAFGWNQVVRGVLGRPGFRPELDALFARGIDPVGVDRYEPDKPTAWPAPAEVLAYRDRVRGALRAAFDDVAALADRDVLAERGRVWRLVLEHEVMHHETLLYMVAQLDRRLLRPPAGAWVRGNGAGLRAAEPGAVDVPGGAVTLGADFAAADFGWDNEFPAHGARVGDFSVDRTPVSNAEFLAFLEAGGYAAAALWTAEDRAWRDRVGCVHPAFWRKDGRGWRYRAALEEVPLDAVADRPVYVSLAEARAYARWRRAGLMSEAEFHRAAEGVPWGDADAANAGFTHLAPTPVGAFPAGASRWGVLDLVGNGWEWTDTPFAPFPGFRAWARTYPGYSADFFDGKHYVMLGGSWATDAALLRPSFRNWFQPHYPYVFAKFRCVVRD